MPETPKKTSIDGIAKRADQKEPRIARPFLKSASNLVKRPLGQNHKSTISRPTVAPLKQEAKLNTVQNKAESQQFPTKQTEPIEQIQKPIPPNSDISSHISTTIPTPNQNKKTSKHRFRSVVSLANRKLPIRLAAIVLASSTLVSALLGIFRDRLLNSYYLDTYPTGIDAYTAAFTVPDFLFFLLTSGALAVSFIPVFNQRLSTGNKKSAWELSSSMLNLMAILTLIASVLIIIFAEPLVRYVVGPGLDEAGTILAINMMRVIAINPFLFSISTILSSIQQALGRFIFYALAPALYNIGILIGIVWFTGGINLFGWQIFEGGIMGVALGVVFGAVLQVLVSLIGLFGLGFDYEFKINWKNQGFRSVLKLLPARSLDQGMDYVNTIITTNLSSRLGAGALRSYNQAYSLSQMPVSLIGVAISTAFFPKLTEDVASGDETKFRQTFRTALSTIIWIALPIGIIAFFARGYVVSFIKNGGDPMIASILATLIISLLSNSIFHIAARGFYAKQDTKTPFKVSILTVGISIIMAIGLTMIGCGVDGLGWAQSIGTLIEVILLLSILQKRSKGKLLDQSFWKNTRRIIFATIITGCVAYSLTKFFPFMASDDSIFMVFPKFCVITLGSFITYLLAGYFLDVEQVTPITKRIKRTIYKNVK